MSKFKYTSSIALAAVLSLGAGTLALAQEKGSVTASRLNVRQGPGTGFKVSKQLDRGAEIQILERAGDWVRISPTEWVHGRYVKALDPVSLPLDLNRLDTTPITPIQPDRVRTPVLPPDQVRAPDILPPDQVSAPAQVLPRNPDVAGIAGSYDLEVRGLARVFMFTKKPKVSLTIEPAGDGRYTVTHTRTDRGKSPVSHTGEGSFADGKLKVDFGAAEERAGMSGRLRGDRSRRSEQKRIEGEWRILASTGEINGHFDRGRGNVGEKGWRQGSVQPIQGDYSLEPTWYAFGNKPVTLLSISGSGDRVQVTRRFVDCDGNAQVHQGTGRVDGRRVRVDFGTAHPDISYSIRENGEITGRWNEEDVWDDRDEHRSEGGWRVGVPQEDIPNMFERGIAKVAAAFRLTVAKVKNLIQRAMARGRQAYEALARTYGLAKAKAGELLGWIKAKTKAVAAKVGDLYQLSKEKVLQLVVWALEKGEAMFLALAEGIGVAKTKAMNVLASVRDEVQQDAQQVAAPE